MIILKIHNQVKKCLHKFIVCNFLIFSVNIAAQQANKVLDRKILLEPGKYMLEQLIDSINLSNIANITYNNKVFRKDELITVSKADPTIKQLLEEIQTALPIEYQVKGENIILTRKKSPSKYRITGTIKDSADNSPLAGTRIYVKDDNVGVFSSVDGSYVIKLPLGNYTLIYSFIGYKTVERIINLDRDIDLNLSLKTETQQVGEVKITSKLRKFYDLEIGRPIESIGAKAIENSNLSNASDILHGRFAGVWATQTSGLPGDHQRIIIRGISSIFGCVDPLYVIDGVSVPSVNLNTLGIADLNIHDIDNITVLKDASSTALFGYQGGNGVILIDTKHGKKENNITFTTRQGIQWFPGRYDLMNTKDFLASMDSCNKQFNINIRKYYPKYQPLIDTLTSTDWQNKIFQVGKVSEYQLSASGTIKNTGYYISGNYLNNQGTIKNTSYRRYTLSANGDRTFFEKLTIEAGYRGSYQENRNSVDGYGGNRILFEGINKSPCMLSTPDSYYFDKHTGYLAYRTYQNYIPLNRSQNTDSLIKDSNKSIDIASNTLRGTMNLSLFRDFNIKVSSDLSFRSYHYLSIISHYNDTSKLGTSFYYTDDNQDQQGIDYIDSYEHVIVLNNQCNLKWQKKISNHNFKIFAGVKYYKDNVYWNDSASGGSGTININSLEVFNRNNEAYIRNSMSIHGPHGAVIRKINSYLGNFNYNYNEKYFISIAGNYENLVEGTNINTKQLFPSLAINWDLAQEYGLNKIKWINHINFYVNWGKAGNYPLNGLSNDLYSDLMTVNFGNVVNNGQYIYQLSNHELKQEILEEYDIGANIDLSGNSRIKAGGDIYHKKNSNLIMLRDIPGYFGTGKMYYNVGEIETRGKEFFIELIPVLTHNVYWYTKFNISTFSQLLNKLSSDSVIKIINNQDILVPEFILKEKQGLGDIYGYMCAGKWTQVDEARNDKKYVKIGGYKYLNADSSNTSLDEKDKVVIGNSMPKFTWNWFHTITYKNFTLDMLWYAVAGVKKYNATRAGTYIAATNRELNSLIKDSISAFATSVFYQSSYFIEDASFIRLKQLTFSYEPRKKLYDKISMRVSITFENLLTLTKYKGYDPEATIYTDNNFSDNAIDRGSFPNPKSFFISITLKL